MKKYLIALMLLLATSISAEMVWVSFDPNIKGSNKSSEAVLESSEMLVRHGASYGRYDGETFSLVVNDSSANADSTYATWYSYPINTENVTEATGEINLMSVTDTSTDGASAFTQYGDSLAVSWVLKTANIPYNSVNFDLVAYGDLTAVSGTAVQVPITLAAATEGVDTLFKAYSWFEVTISDSTRWGDLYTQYWRIYGTGDSAATIAGTYNAVGPDFYKYWIVDPGSDDDSIGWSHYYWEGDSMGVIDTADITGSAQNLDSGMTINFAAGTGHTDGDTFMFVAADSLWYGKTSTFKLRMGLNLLRQ
jgi:hypothetical protein